VNKSIHRRLAIVMSLSFLVMGFNLSRPNLSHADEVVEKDLAVTEKTEVKVTEEVSPGDVSPAEEAKGDFSGGFKKVGQGFKNGTKATGRGFKKAGATLGQGFKKAGTTMGRGFQKAGSAIKEFFVGKKSQETVQEPGFVAGDEKGNLSPMQDIETMEDDVIIEDEKAAPLEDNDWA